MTNRGFPFPLSTSGTLIWTDEPLFYFWKLSIWQFFYFFMFFKFFHASCRSSFCLRFLRSIEGTVDFSVKLVFSSNIIFHDKLFGNIADYRTGLWDSSNIALYGHRLIPEWYALFFMNRTNKTKSFTPFTCFIIVHPSY